MRDESDETTETPELTETIKVPPLMLRRMNVTIQGISPLIMKRFGPLAQSAIEKGQELAGKTKMREPRNKKAEVEDGLHRLSTGRGYGFPAGGVKKCIVSGTHRDLGLAMTTVRKAFFLIPDDDVNNLIKINKAGKPTTRTDRVGLKGRGGGSADVRYRAMFTTWEMTLQIEYDAERIDIPTLLALIQRGGWSTGIGEWRPDRSGEFGRFRIKETTEK